jgi:hypothetical protein
MEQGVIPDRLRILNPLQHTVEKLAHNVIQYQGGKDDTEYQNDRRVGKPINYCHRTVAYFIH